jgi:ParB family chromosome partitioning protein
MANRKNSKGRLELSSSIKQTLGRGAGTSALIPDNIDEQIANNPEGLVKELSSHFAMIPIAQIEANMDQPRREFEKEALVELAESIKVHGIIQPITVRRLDNKKYQIISGERRWRASKIAELEEVPAFIRIANDQTLMEMALIENIQREDLNPFEIAVCYFRLKDEFDLTDEVLAERVGKKRSTVTNYLRLMDLNVDVLDALKGQEITMGHARAIAGVKDKVLQKEFLKEIQGSDLSVRAAEELSRSYKETQKKAKEKAKTKSENKFQLEYDRIVEDFQEFFGTRKIKIHKEDKTSQKGQIVIDFDNNDQLHFIYKCIEQM